MNVQLVSVEMFRLFIVLYCQRVVGRGDDPKVSAGETFSFPKDT